MKIVNVNGFSSVYSGVDVAKESGKKKQEK